MKQNWGALICASILACTLAAGCTPKEVQDLTAEIDSLGEISLDSGEMIESANAQYDALPEDQKSQVDNYPTLEEANKRYSEILYAEISKELEEVTELESSFFAQRYDMNGMATAKQKASAAISNSDSEKYPEAYTSLKTELGLFRDFISAEKAGSYSVETSAGEHPFAVNAEAISYGICAEPLVKRSSDYPYNVCFHDSETTDDPITLDYSVQDTLRWYACDFRQIDTTEIEIQDENGELRKAFVNTEVVLSDPPQEYGANAGPYQLGENSCYLLQSEKHGLVLAVADVNSGQGYIPYVLY